MEVGHVLSSIISASGNKGAKTSQGVISVIGAPTVLERLPPASPRSHQRFRTSFMHLLEPLLGELTCSSREKIRGALSLSSATFSARALPVTSGASLILSEEQENRKEIDRMSSDGCFVTQTFSPYRGVKLKRGRKPPMTDEFQWFLIFTFEKT